MMNKRYTDIDALIAMLRNNIDLPFNGGDSWAHIVQIKDKLIEHIEKNAPVADVVEVVRCEKCKFYEIVEYWHPDCNGTKQVCRLLKRQMQEDDFCSYGERKEDYK